MILDGKIVKKQILEELKEELLKLNRPLGLTIIQVGDDSASSIYMKQKLKLASTLDYDVNFIKLDDNIKEEELLKIIDIENNNDKTDGIIVEMPLPKHLDSKIIRNAIDYNKDIDGLCQINAGKLLHNEECLMPCTPVAVMDILDYYNIPIKGKHVAIVGRSEHVGRPLSILFLNRDATVTVCHSKTENIKEITSTADILVAAVGKKHFIKKDMVKQDAVIIDVGINYFDGKIYGDVDFDDVMEKAYITPVPGGIGQMTVSEVGKNLYKAYQLKNK